MVDYYTKFSVEVFMEPNEIKWSARVLRRWHDLYYAQEDAINPDPPAFTWEVRPESIWFWSDDQGEVAFADFIARFLLRFRPDGALAFEYAHTASRPVIDAYGGGVCAITAEGVTWHDTWKYMKVALRRFKITGKQPVRIRRE